ncbi:hypothetical protein ANCDUO_06256 [Ancylostoma duodenale]|uniref:glucuronosyltransferase n=1 Tax=Ancylostoma duodenale TaxID=51022 RepID=A0A0C2DLG7_9BILA|nr:hypothetical protein ANCDUO_06256 [Ancylostoma duodenale]
MKGPSVWEAPPCEGMCMKWSDFDQIVEQTYKLCKAILEDDVLLNRLRHSKFDLVFSECFDACAPGIWEMIGIKNIVLVSALGMMPRLYDITGMSTVPSFMPGKNSVDNDKRERICGNRSSYYEHDTELSELLDKNPTTVLISMGSLAQSKDMPTWLKRARSSTNNHWVKF